MYKRLCQDPFVRVLTAKPTNLEKAHPNSLEDAGSSPTEERKNATPCPRCKITPEAAILRLSAGCEAWGWSKKRWHSQASQWRCHHKKSERKQSDRAQNYRLEGWLSHSTLFCCHAALSG
jgi:hypothetical protein